MDWKKEWKVLATMVAVFLGCFYLPLDNIRFRGAVVESLYLVKWYAREHVLLCLVPAFFIAGGIATFIAQGSVMKYLGAGANKVLAYGVASVSGTILAVCSCTVLPLFAGIYRMGAGLGPATAFLYSGPAINVLAIALTARVLGLEMGIARAIGAILVSIVIGLLMHVIFRREELAKAELQVSTPPPEVQRPLWKSAAIFASMVGVLVFANWTRTGSEAIFRVRWLLVVVFLTGLVAMAVAWVSKAEGKEWIQSTWGFAKQILPLLLGGVLVAGLLLGRSGRDSLIPSGWIDSAVGGNSLQANLCASVLGAFMYFATLTEVPILRGLMGAGMGKGPALALLLAGPAISLPNMLVIRSIMGTRKTIVYVLLVVVMATISGMIFGSLIT